MLMLIRDEKSHCSLPLFRLICFCFSCVLFFSCGCVYKKNLAAAKEISPLRPPRSYYFFSHTAFSSFPLDCFFIPLLLFTLPWGWVSSTLLSIISPATHTRARERLCGPVLKVYSLLAPCFTKNSQRNGYCIIRASQR